MSGVEAFSKYYSLTPGAKKSLETILSGREEAIRVSHAMQERLKEEAARASMQFLAVAIVDHTILRVYFRTPGGLYVKDVPKKTGDASRDLFLDMVAHNTDLGFDPDDDFYLEIEHHPN